MGKRKEGRKRRKGVRKGREKFKYPTMKEMVKESVATHPIY